MPPCCQIPPGPYGNFLLSLKYDTEQFSKYVGDGSPAGICRHAGFLTSGLHLEMKLWPPRGHLPRQYKFNDAQYNSWVAMSKRTTAPALIYPRFIDAEKCNVFLGLRSSFPRRSGCALLDYDQWILQQMTILRNTGLKHSGLKIWIPLKKKDKPPELGTFGLAQKLINIYFKYEFCWQIAGIWPAFGSYVPPFSPKDFLCALHAPIDNRVIIALLNLPVGQYLLKDTKLLKKVILQRKGKPSNEQSYICQSSDNEWRPWSKLVCLRTYYGFQLVFRRIAMATWPDKCGCFGSDDAIRKCAEMFEKKFGKEHSFKKDDWIRIACEIPDEIIRATIDELKELSQPAQNNSESTKPKLKNGGIGEVVPAKVEGRHCIWLEEGPKAFLKIVSECCGKHGRNDGMICLNHNRPHIWLKNNGASRRYLIGEILIARGSFTAEPGYIKAPADVPNCGVGGVNYQGGVPFESADDAVKYLKRYFDVLACRGNSIYDQLRINKL